MTQLSPTNQATVAAFARLVGCLPRLTKREKLIKICEFEQKLAEVQERNEALANRLPSGDRLVYDINIMMIDGDDSIGPCQKQAAKDAELRRIAKIAGVL